MESGVDLTAWRGLLRTGMWAAWAGIAMVVIQMAIYVFWPPPETTEGYFDLLSTIRCSACSRWTCCTW